MTDWILAFENYKDCLKVRKGSASKVGSACSLAAMAWANAGGRLDKALKNVKDKCGDSGDGPLGA